MWYDVHVPRRMEEWHIPGKTASKRVRYRLQTRTVERLSAQHQTVFPTFLGFRKPLYHCIEGMCHSSTRPGAKVILTSPLFFLFLIFFFMKVYAEEQRYNSSMIMLI